MPTAISYPGVYVEEVPSGIRTITGVATSIAAFIGRTRRGATDAPTIINSFGDFERLFGGVDPSGPAENLPLAFAVRDFYANGGAQAIIVRVFKAQGGGAKPATVRLSNLSLDASSKGLWGNTLRARVDHKVSEEVAKLWGLDSSRLFNLTVHDTATKLSETFINVTLAESPNRLDRVLKRSALVRALDYFVPSDAVPEDHDDIATGKTGWESESSSSVGVANADKAVDSDELDVAAYKGDAATKTGLNALLKTDLFNLLCIPPDVIGSDTKAEVYQAALQLCVARRAMLLVDPPVAWKSANDVAKDSGKAVVDLGLSGTNARNAAIYFPRLIEVGTGMDQTPPSGAVAGLFARIDAARGVWKAPAGIDAALNGAHGLTFNLTDQENGQLNPLGVNCLRAFPVVGRVCWGARTMAGADLISDEYKYVPVRRTALFIEESLIRGLRWVLSEPNEEPLWAQIRLSVGAFMHNLFRQGAFQGRSPSDAYYVKCDRETTTRNDVNLGVVNVVVGFAPLKPGEFVTIKVEQITGLTEV